MPSPLDLTWPSPLLAEGRDPAIERELKRALGFVPVSTRYTARVPWVPELDRLAILPPTPSLDSETSELAGLAASHATFCRHCYGSVRAAMRLLGHDERRIETLEQRLYGDEVSEKLQSALEFVRRVCTLEVRRQDIAELGSVGHTREQIVDLTVYAAISGIYGRLNTSLATPIDPLEKLARSFMRPLIGYILRRGVRKRRAVWEGKSSRSEDLVGPFQRLLALALPTPGASELRKVIDRALAESVNARRDKLLAIAVVGRGAGSTLLEEEAVALLAAEGAPGDQVTRTLDTLDSAMLDEFARSFLQYARDSVTYQPADLQERARAMATGQIPERTLDAIATVALANGLARLQTLALLESGG